MQDSRYDSVTVLLRLRPFYLFCTVRYVGLRVALTEDSLMGLQHACDRRGTLSVYPFELERRSSNLCARV